MPLSKRQKNEMPEAFGAGQDGSDTLPDCLAMMAAMEIEAAGDGAEGKPRLPRFSMVGYTGGDMRLGGWRYPVVVDLAGMAIPRQNLTVRAGHEERVGHAERVAIEEGKLVASGVISCTGQVAREVVADAKNGFPWQASIGASVDQFEFVKENQSVLVNGREFNGPVNVVRKSTLREISFVDLAADTNTSVSVAAKAAQNQETLKEPDMAKAEEKEKEVKAAEAPNPPEPLKIQAAALAFDKIDAEIAEGRRRAVIEDMTVAAIRKADHEPTISATLRALAGTAIEANWTAQKFDTEIVRGSRSPLPPRAGRVDAPPSDTVLEAAAMLAAGYGGDKLVRSHGEQTVEAAEKQYGRSIGLQELILTAAQANGYSGRTRITPGNWREVINWASPGSREIQAAGFSTVDLTGILGAVANKALAVTAAEPVWLAPKIAGTASHANFHSHTVYSLAMNGELLPVGPTGELKHLDFSEESYTRQVGTRGAILRLSRTDVINDDLGVFAKNASGLARKAYTTREKALFTALCATAAGASFFTAAHGNYLTGATTAFGTAGMALGIKAFRGLKGPDGDPIMVEPAICLVPPTLEDEARRLLAAGSNAIVVGQITAAATKTLGTSANIYAGRFGGAPLVSPWLENTALTGNSAAYWYLLADPAQYPALEIAYLNGNQTPTVEYFGLESQADTLGMTWRIFWDFGVATAEWRAGVKLAGA